MAISPGDRFGLLTVLRAIGTARHGQTRYRCQCDCGRRIRVLTCSLVNRLTRACGRCQTNGLGLHFPLRPARPSLAFRPTQQPPIF